MPTIGKVKPGSLKSGGAAEPVDELREVSGVLVMLLTSLIPLVFHLGHPYESHPGLPAIINEVALDHRVSITRGQDRVQEHRRSSRNGPWITSSLLPIEPTTRPKWRFESEFFTFINHGNQVGRFDQPSMSSAMQELKERSSVRNGFDLQDDNVRAVDKHRKIARTRGRTISTGGS